LIWFTARPFRETSHGWEPTTLGEFDPREGLDLVNIVPFIYVMFGLLCCFRLGLALKDWVHGLPIKPDPWDAEITEKLKQPDCVPVCHHCFTPQMHDKWFCPECGTAVGPYNNCLPYVNIFTQGEVLRNGVRNHLTRSFLTLIGYLLFSTVEYWFFAPIYWYFFFRNRRQSLRRERADQEDASTAPQSPEQ
jgi:hypothetical protein